MKTNHLHTITVFFIVLLNLLTIHSQAQNTAFTGMFTAQNGTLILRLKPVDNEYHGTLQTTNYMLVLKGLVSQGKMSGTLFTETGNYAFDATANNGILNVFFDGKTYRYDQVSQDHQLDGFDLTPYFKNDASKNTESTNSGGKNPYYNQIAGSQLVFYQRTSYLNDSNASSLTYVNFCPDGRFGINYEGSFSVEGDYGGNAHGAGYGTNYGTWEIIAHQGGHAVRLHFANGEQGIYPINPQHLQAGRWRIGNTQYALQQGKVSCR